MGGPGAWAGMLAGVVDHVASTVAAADGAGQGGGAVDWSVTAIDLDWSCARVVEHLAGDFVGYAGQLTAPQARGQVPYGVRLAGHPDTQGMADVLRSSGGLLVAAVATTPSGTTSWHPCGPAGPGDFAAMGILEALVHTYDLAITLAWSWQPDPAPCSAVLDRLFGDVTRTDDPWTDLLWATGRVPRGDTPRRDRDWRWLNTGR